MTTTLDEFDKAVREGLRKRGHRFIVVKVEQGSVPDLPALTLDGKEAKYRFARYIEATEGKQILKPRYTHI